MTQIASTRALTLRVQREMPATPDELFDALVNPEKQRAWLSAPGLDGGTVQTSVDLRVGGRWESRFRPSAETRVHDVQTYLEIDRPRRLVTDLVSEAIVGGRPMPTLHSRIDLTFAPTAAGMLLTVEQTGFPSVEMRDFYEAVVWPGGLDRIERFLTAS